MKSQQMRDRDNRDERRSHDRRQPELPTLPRLPLPQVTPEEEYESDSPYRYVLLQGPFHQSLVAIGPVVSEEKIKM
jgi:hypothetical protein